MHSVQHRPTPHTAAMSDDRPARSSPTPGATAAPRRRPSRRPGVRHAAPAGYPAYAVPLRSAPRFVDQVLGMRAVIAVALAA